MLITFRYKPVHGRFAPIITVGLKVAGTWCPLEVYVDSGAACTVLHAQIADGIGFEYRLGERTYLQVGDGGFIPVYVHDLELQLGAERFVSKVGFSEKLGVGFNLLGRAGVFDRFRVCFQERERILTFETAQTP